MSWFARWRLALQQWWYHSKLSRRHAARLTARHGDHRIHRIPSDGYPTLAAFYTRRYQRHARPVDHAARSICSPIDGIIAPHSKSMAPLLLADTPYALHYHHHEALLITPVGTDSYRIHTPIAGSITTCTVLPATENVAARLVCDITTAQGYKMVLIAADSSAVGTAVATYNPGINYQLAGSEIGYITFGTPIVGLFAAPYALTPLSSAGTRVQMGSRIAQWAAPLTLDTERTQATSC